MSMLAHAAAQVLTAALADDAAVAALVHAIGDDGEVASPVPVIWILDQLAVPWGSKDRPGSEVRIDLAARDRGDGGNIAAIAQAVDAVIAGLPRAFAGWEVGEWIVLRRQLTRRRDGERRIIWSLRLRGWPHP